MHVLESVVSERYPPCRTSERIDARRPSRAFWPVVTAVNATFLIGWLLRAQGSAVADLIDAETTPTSERTPADPGRDCGVVRPRPADRQMSAAEIRHLARTLRRLNRQWSHWPGAIVRDPRLTEPHFLQHRRLLLTLAAALEQHLSGCRELVVVDVGAGKRPYYPLLASRSHQYVGVDLPGTPDPQVLGASERLPFQTGSVDLVLSTQTLEHADDPALMLEECRRVLRPGGLMFASTHGMSYYHPIPVDHWRWTHTGLRLMFERGGFNVRSVEATGGTLITLATIFATHFLGAATRFGCPGLASKLLIPFNLVIGALDDAHRAPPKSEAELGWGSMPWTYVVVAEKP